MFARDIKNYLSDLTPPKKSCCRNMLISGQQINCGIKSGCGKCYNHFIRGVFLSVGKIVDPEKAYHLELSMPDQQTTDFIIEILNKNELYPKKSTRKGNLFLYFKESESIVDFLNFIGAQKAAFDFLNVNIKKDFRNKANRLTNCETANIDKTVHAAQSHIEAIKYIEENNIILLDELKETADLRIENDAVSLGELAALHKEPITKSGVNHRLKKLVEIAKNGG